MDADRPRLVSYKKHDYGLFVKVLHKNIEYEYVVPDNYPIQQILRKSYFGFRDWNYIKDHGSRILTEEEKYELYKSKIKFSVDK